MKLRRVLLSAACLALGLYLLAGVGSAWESGTLTFSFSKSGTVHEFIRSQDPLGFYMWMAFDVLVATALLFVAIRACFSVLRRKPDARESLTGDMLEHFDQLAPSGLWPLVVALGMFLIVLLVFVSF